MNLGKLVAASTPLVLATLGAAAYFKIQDIKAEEIKKAMLEEAEHPCSIDQKTQIEESRNFVKTHREELLRKIKDRCSKSGITCPNDEEIIPLDPEKTEAYCAAERIQLEKTGKRAKKVHGWAFATADERAPGGAFTVYPQAFQESGFCGLTGVIYHEGVHAQTGFKHPDHRDPDSIQTEWLYPADYELVMHCLSTRYPEVFRGEEPFVVIDSYGTLDRSKEGQSIEILKSRGASPEATQDILSLLDPMALQK